MSPVLAGRYSVHASAFIRTRLSRPELQYYLSKLFIPAINLYETDSGWALQCICYGIQTHNTVPAGTIIIVGGLVIK